MKAGENDWASFKFTSYDNPFIDPQEIDEARMQLPAVVFEQEYMANPMENAANPFGTDKIKSCIKQLSNEKISTIIICCSIVYNECSKHILCCYYRIKF